MALTLPPLNSLRAFEAAARTGSYVAAADELGVSAAAIGQHIRKLEEYTMSRMEPEFPVLTQWVGTIQVHP